MEVIVQDNIQSLKQKARDLVSMEITNKGRDKFLATEMGNRAVAYAFVQTLIVDELKSHPGACERVLELLSSSGDQLRKLGIGAYLSDAERVIDQCKADLQSGRRVKDHIV